MNAKQSKTYLDTFGELESLTIDDLLSQLADKTAQATLYGHALAEAHHQVAAQKAQTDCHSETITLDAQTLRELFASVNASALFLELNDDQLDETRQRRYDTIQTQMKRLAALVQ
jgi:hypothetical protein